jgi:hypothetical protein
MRFYTQQHDFYCGVDLHARSMYLCVLDRDGKIVLHRNLPAGPEPFLQAIAPYRGDLVVGVECIFCWYWLADLCAAEKIEFVLGHALYMKAIHGGKAKNDKIDSHKIAHLLRGGNFPLAYVYPRQMRATRDLLRGNTSIGSPANTARPKRSPSLLIASAAPFITCCVGMKPSTTNASCAQRRSRPARGSL